MATVTFIQGDTINETIVIKDKDKVIINITGGTVKFRIVHDLSDLEADALYVNNNVTISDGDAGEATLAITRTISKEWTPDDYFWEVEYIDSGSNVSHSDSGILIIKKSIYSADA